MASDGVLSDYIPEPEWCAQASISQRTSARYRNAPDGLPYLELGGRILIPRAEAIEWLRARIRRPNPRRRPAGLAAT
jgi:hypothetical protein